MLAFSIDFDGCDREAAVVGAITWPEPDAGQPAITDLPATVTGRDSRRDLLRLMPASKIAVGTCRSGGSGYIQQVEAA